MTETAILGADKSLRIMSNFDVRTRRREMLSLPHVLPLTVYAEELRRRGLGDVPDFDPLDGGINARALFLFEKPGPMTDANRSGKRHGSGFVSRDNDDPTAAAVFQFMHKASIPRHETILWNTIPWWNGTRKVTREEFAKGTAALGDLLTLLPNLRVAVLVGKKATKARNHLPEHLPQIISAHPSPLVHASRPRIWDAIPDEWAKANAFIR